MALADVTKIPGREAPEPDGRGFRTLRLIDMPASYTTGGESLTTAQLGFSKPPDWVEIDPKDGYVFQYDKAAQKVKAYYGDNNNAADGPLIEVPAATNLSAVLDVVVRGHGIYAA